MITQYLLYCVIIITHKKICLQTDNFKNVLCNFPLSHRSLLNSYINEHIYRFFLQSRRFLEHFFLHYLKNFQFIFNCSWFWSVCCYSLTSDCCPSSWSGGSGYFIVKTIRSNVPHTPSILGPS